MAKKIYFLRGKITERQKEELRKSDEMYLECAYNEIVRLEEGHDKSLAVKRKQNAKDHPR